MADVQALVGEKILVQLGDGVAAPNEAFAHPCMINLERGVSFASETGEAIVPSCTNPSDPAFKQVFKDGLSMSASGGGTLHTTDLEYWIEWMKSDTAKNVRIFFDAGAVNGGGYVQVPMKLTAFNITGPRKNVATVELTLMSHGAYAWTDQTGAP